MNQNKETISYKHGSVNASFLSYGNEWINLQDQYVFHET